MERVHAEEVLADLKSQPPRHAAHIGIPDNDTPLRPSPPPASAPPQLSPQRHPDPLACAPEGE